MIEPFVPSPPTEPPPAEEATTLSPVAPAPAAPPTPTHRHRGLIGMVFAVSLLSAVLASGATAALEARPPTTVATTTPATAVNTSTTPATTTAAGVTVAASTASSVAAIVASDNPAVVTIETTVSSGAGVRASGSAATGVGSGFIYTTDGNILTAAHVVESASQITVTLADGRTFNGTLAASNLNLDVAVVKIDASGLPTIPLGASGTVRVGQTAIVIGDPLGEYPGSATIGIVSGLDRSITVADEATRQSRDLTGLVQTDAAINPGNSGGPLIDPSGAVIGIISAGSSAAEGIGFAVPINAAAAVIAAAKTA